MKNRNMHVLERLKTAGDSFLKLAVSIFTCRSTFAHSDPESLPNALHNKRKVRVENLYLYNLGKDLKADFFIPCLLMFRWSEKN
jgi:Ribonuclease III domain